MTDHDQEGSPMTAPHEGHTDQGNPMKGDNASATLLDAGDAATSVLPSGAKATRGMQAGMSGAAASNVRGVSGARQARYAEAVWGKANTNAVVAAVMAVADEEHAALRARIEAALDEHMFWGGEPDGYVVPISAIRAAHASPAEDTTPTEQQAQGGA